MKLSIRSQQGDVVCLLLQGDISQRELATTDEPIADLLGDSAYHSHIVIDMSEVTSLDSSGVNWLLICQKRVRENNGTFVLHSLAPIAKNVIRVLNLQTVFNLASNENEAVQLLGGGS